MIEKVNTLMYGLDANKEPVKIKAESVSVDDILQLYFTSFRF